MGMGHGDAAIDEAIFFGVGDKRLQVIADDFRHAGGGNRDDLRLVQSAGVLQTQIHVVVAAEDRRVFGHRVGDAGDRLFEMAVKIGAKVGHAPLGAVDVRQGIGKSQRAKHRAKRLAGFRRVNGQRLALEIQRFILGGGGPGKDLLHALGIVRFLQLPLIAEQLLVFILFE